jgi:hypothetical protein
MTIPGVHRAAPLRCVLKPRDVLLVLLDLFFLNFPHIEFYAQDAPVKTPSNNTAQNKQRHDTGGSGILKKTDELEKINH